MRHAPDSHAHSQKGNPQPDSYDRRKPLGSYLLASGPAAHRPMDEELNKLSAAGDEKAILALVQAVRNAALHYREDGVAAEDPHSSEQTARSAGEQEQKRVGGCPGNSASDGRVSRKSPFSRPPDDPTDMTWPPGNISAGRRPSDISCSPRGRPRSAPRPPSASPPCAQASVPAALSERVAVLACSALECWWSTKLEEAP